MSAQGLPVHEPDSLTSSTVHSQEPHHWSSHHLVNNRDKSSHFPAIPGWPSLLLSRQLCRRASKLETQEATTQRSGLFSRGGGSKEDSSLRDPKLFTPKWQLKEMDNPCHPALNFMWKVLQPTGYMVCVKARDGRPMAGGEVIGVGKKRVPFKEKEEL